MSAKSHETPTALILAGGLGTRLRPVVSDRPKVLAPVNGRPFLFYVLDQLASANVRDVLLSTGYMADSIRDTVGASYGELTIRYVQEEQPLGTGGAIAEAARRAKGELLLVLNGDSFAEIDLAQFFMWHRGHTYRKSLCAVQVPDASRYGSLQVSDDGHLSGFFEKSETKESGWINAGIYLLPRQALADLRLAVPYSIERDVFPDWVGTDFGVYRAAGAKFLDIGTPDSLAAAGAFFRSRTR